MSSVTPKHTHAFKERGSQPSGTQHWPFWWRLCSSMIAASPMESTSSDSRRYLRSQLSGSVACLQMCSWRACGSSYCRFSLNLMVPPGFLFSSRKTRVISSLQAAAGANHTNAHSLDQHDLSARPMAIHIEPHLTQPTIEAPSPRQKNPVSLQLQTQLQYAGQDSISETGWISNLTIDGNLLREWNFLST